VLVVDGAHNPAAAEALVATMDERLGARRRLLVFGASRDKDVDGVLARLLGGSSWIVVTRSEHPRAMDVGQLQYAVMRHVRPAGGTTVLTADTAAAALDLALGAAGPDDAVVATGSLFLVADVREAFAARGGMPMPPRDPPPAARPAARGAGQ
jgi:dihydrofolate synthase/folylpolyglutamate synthase